MDLTSTDRRLRQEEAWFVAGGNDAAGELIRGNVLRTVDCPSSPIRDCAPQQLNVRGVGYCYGENH